MSLNIELIILRGLPASGKTAFAKEWVEENPGNRIRISRDDIREMFIAEHHKVWYNLPNRKQLEDQITQIVKLAIKNAIFSGVNVIYDATNLKKSYYNHLIDLAQTSIDTYNKIYISNAELSISIKPMNTSLEECIARDRAKGESGGRKVGEKVIRKIAKKYNYK